MQIAIVTNTKAGGGKAKRLSYKLLQTLTTKEINAKIFDIHEWNDGIYDYDRIWVAGGDGTINYFVNRFNDIKKPISLFGGGTGNDFYEFLYGKKAFNTQVEKALTGQPRPIDAGICNDRLFLNGVGIGFEGIVSKDLEGVKKSFGKASFFLPILKNIFNYSKQWYSISSTEKFIEGDFLMISVTNGKRSGGGFYISPFAKPNDGKLDVNIIKPLSPLKRIWYMPLIKKGKHTSLPFINHFQTGIIKISSDRIMHAHLDGEYFKSQEFNIRILPDHFNFIY